MKAFVKIAAMSGSSPCLVCIVEWINCVRSSVSGLYIACICTSKFKLAILQLFVKNQEEVQQVLTKILILEDGAKECIV